MAAAHSANESSTCKASQGAVRSQHAGPHRDDGRAGNHPLALQLVGVFEYCCVKTAATSDIAAIVRALVGCSRAKGAINPQSKSRGPSVDGCTLAYAV